MVPTMLAVTFGADQFPQQLYNRTWYIDACGKDRVQYAGEVVFEICVSMKEKVKMMVSYGLFSAFHSDPQMCPARPLAFSLDLHGAYLSPPSLLILPAPAPALP